MNLIATMVSLVTIALLVILIFQIRNQRQATYELLADSRVKTRLFEDSDETTSMVLAQTIHDISAGRHDASLEDDTFALKIVRELVKRNIPKSKWMEIQSNQRLVHELFLILNDEETENRPSKRQAQS